MTSTRHTKGPIRLDATVGRVYHDPEQHTLFGVGRTKEGTYDTQFKLMLGASVSSPTPEAGFRRCVDTTPSPDPMGLPVAVDVVSGQQAEDPLYLPVYLRIRRTLGSHGLLYVGDAINAVVQPLSP